MNPVWGLAWYVVTYLLVSSWVYIDAKARGSSIAVLWAILFLPSGIVTVYYLVGYRRQHERVRSRTKRERQSAVLALAAVLAALVTMFAPPVDSTMQTVYWVVSFVSAFPVSYVVYHRLIDKDGK